jgi:hypothetical protein
VAIAVVVVVILETLVAVVVAGVQVVAQPQAMYRVVAQAVTLLH